MKNKPHLFIAIGLAVFAAGSVCAEESYTVSRGDSLGKIARQFGVSYVEIMEANDLKHTHIYEGQVLKIPTDVSGAAPANAGPVRITPRPVGAIDRYRAPGLDAPPEKTAIRKAIDEEESRVGQFSGEMPIQPLPGGDPPTVYVKPKK
ncbi:MAG: LysM peptidoglycan-binding domain-containing protein, partial [Verrucomicrobiales bacterium]|nr:LysM peptidoglycan-binding domain-containing protein [Verrucomicrobiales bacterium]